MADETENPEAPVEETVPSPGKGRAGPVLLAVIVLALVLGGAYWVRGVIQRGRDDTAAVALAETHLDGGYIENALAELDSVSTPKHPGRRRTMEVARRFIQTAKAMPELSPQQEGGLKPPEVRLMPPAPGSSIHLPAYRPPTTAEAVKIRVDYERVIAQVRQGKSVDDVALQLNIPRTYVQALLEAQAP